MLLLLATAMQVSHSNAQTYPTKPITIVVGFAPGGLMDTVSRLFSERLSAKLGQPVIVENRGGANGNIAHRRVASAEPDGYTILGATPTLAVNETIYARRGYTADQFKAIAIVAASPEMISTHPSNSKTLKDMLETVRSSSAQFGTAGTGSMSHIAMQYFFEKLANVPTTHIPFQGGAPAVGAALGNQIPLVAAPPASGAAASVRSGGLRALAVASDKRLSILPDVPTFAELGYPNFTSLVWAGFFVPANTPKGVIETLSKSIAEILQERTIVEKLEQIGFEPMFLDQQASDRLFRSDISKWKDMIEAIGLKVE
jgi:tripartite-type tricarboxylate transporter receptor subunit TctC